MNNHRKIGTRTDLVHFFPKNLSTSVPNVIHLLLAIWNLCIFNTNASYLKCNFLIDVWTFFTNHKKNGKMMYNLVHFFPKVFLSAQFQQSTCRSLQLTHFVMHIFLLRSESPWKADTKNPDRDNEGSTTHMWMKKSSAKTNS